jgi:hypothetical protein
MATKTKKKRRRVSSGPPRRKPSKKPSRNGAAVKSAGTNRFAANQPLVPGLDDVDERVPALDKLCQQVLADRDAQMNAKERVAKGLEDVGKLLKEYKLECYIINGKKFYEVPGEAHVKIVRVKQDG